MAVGQGFPPDIPTPFVLLDSLDAVDATQLAACRYFAHSPLWQGLEAMAQAAALHQRFLNDFTQHAFLLSLDECLYPAVENLHGHFRITATLCGQTQRAAAYTVETLGPDWVWSLRLHIGLRPYDDAFKQNLLEPHYREVFAWLTQQALA